MLLTYFSFLFSQVFGFGIHVILLSMFVIIVISLLILAFNLKRIVSIVKSRKFLRMFIFAEIIFLIAFTFFAVVRAYDPDILDGEKEWNLPLLMH